jgi:hypothetical protein
MQSLNDRLAGCNVFSKTDSVKAYHQINIAEEDIPTPFGLWEFLFMAFGQSLPVSTSVAGSSESAQWNFVMGLVTRLTAKVGLILRNQAMGESA